VNVKAIHLATAVVIVTVIWVFAGELLGQFTKLGAAAPVPKVAPHAEKTPAMAVGGTGAPRRLWEFSSRGTGAVLGADPHMWSPVVPGTPLHGLMLFAGAGAVGGRLAL
jgi:hypothetical protein